MRMKYGKAGLAARPFFALVVEIGRGMVYNTFDIISEKREWNEKGAVRGNGGQNPHNGIPYPLSENVSGHGLGDSSGGAERL